MILRVFKNSVHGISRQTSQITSALMFLILALLIAACSAGTTQSLDEGDAAKKGTGSDDSNSGAAKENQNSQVAASQEGSCAFQYESASATEKIDIPGVKAADCQEACRKKMPQGVLGTCVFNNIPIGIDFSSTTGNNGTLGGIGANNATDPSKSQAAQAGGNAISSNLPIPRSGCAIVEKSAAGASFVRTVSVSGAQLCTDHCATVTLGAQSASGVCYFDGIKIADLAGALATQTDSASKVGSCRRAVVLENGTRTADTDQKTLAECSKICVDLKQTTKQLDCTFDGKPLLSLTVGAAQPGAGETPELCKVSVTDSASGTSTALSQMEANQGACRNLCESLVQDSSRQIRCQFGEASHFLDVNLGDRFDPNAQVSCSTSVSNQGSQNAATSTLSGGSCRSKCMELWKQNPSSLVCKVN